MKAAIPTVQARQMHALDNPIWNSLTTLHAHFAEGGALAKRFPPEVTTLAAMGEPTAEAYNSLAQVLKGSGAALFLDQPPAMPPGWNTIHASEILQMVCEKSEIEAAVRGGARGDTHHAPTRTKWSRSLN